MQSLISRIDRDELGLSRGVRQTVKTLLPFAAFGLYSEDVALQDGPRLLKWRRAPREPNPPRNSQLETHRDDEAGGGRQSAAPAHSPKSSSGNRFPHA